MAEMPKYAARVIDVSDEPKRMLTPIRGYEKEPLMTLEEAVKSVISDVPDVLQMVWVVKQQCPTVPEDGLTVDECTSIMLYTLEWFPSTESFYFILNRRLRDVDRKRLLPWFPYLKLLIWSLSKIPSQTCTVYRGVREDLHELYRTGKESIWWGFSSCTSTIGMLESDQFVGRDGKRTIFSIECHSAKNIQKHSFYPSENEVLLLPARQFRNKSCLDMGHDLYMIQLEEINPPFPLIQPVQSCDVSTPTPSPVPIANHPSPSTTTNSPFSFLNIMSATSFTKKIDYICPCCKRSVWIYELAGFFSGAICLECQTEHGNAIFQNCSRRIQ